MGALFSARDTRRKETQSHFSFTIRVFIWNIKLTNKVRWREIFIRYSTLPFLPFLLDEMHTKPISLAASVYCLILNTFIVKIILSFFLLFFFFTEVLSSGLYCNSCEPSLSPEQCNATQMDNSNCWKIIQDNPRLGRTSAPHVCSLSLDPVQAVLQRCGHWTTNRTNHRLSLELHSLNPRHTFVCTHWHILPL